MKFNLRICFLSLLTLFLAVSCVPSSGETNSTDISPEVDLARAYISARQAYNIQQVKPFLANDVQIIENGEVMSLEDVASFLRYAEAVGENWEIVSCSGKSEGNISEVNCPILIYSDISEALGFEPVAGNIYTFVISDNKIVSTELKLNLDFWNPNVFYKMMRWVETNYPRHVSKMMTSRRLSSTGVKTPESRGLIGVTLAGIELWKIHAAEYIEFAKSQ